MLTIQVISEGGTILAQESGQESCSLRYDAALRQGDCIVIHSQKAPCALSVHMDPAMADSLIWMKKPSLVFQIPFGEAKEAYAPETFAGEHHELRVGYPPKELWESYRNLSENPMDQRGEAACYPHCSATVETRGESVFAARNTIDGRHENTFHGEWPYTSWGDNEDPDAQIAIEFGGKVWTDKLGIRLRADFPHDSYWHTVKLVFSDGSSETLFLKKSGDMQFFTYEPRTTEWVRLCELQKAADESPFPALTQWSVFGKRV